MNANIRRSEKERRLRPWVIGLSTVAWLGLLISIVGAIYGVIIALSVLVAQALWLARVRGNGVRLGPDQLPDVWKKVVEASRRFDLERPPEAYVLQAGGTLNALATKLLSRHFIILFSDLIDAADGDANSNEDATTSELDFIVAHEVAHVACGHLKAFTLPARVVPLLGPAYSRACEYTCDEYGLEFVGDLEISSRALAILAAGGKVGRRANLDAFVGQRESTGSFFSAVCELNLSHPYLPKRIAALRMRNGIAVAPAPARAWIAFPLAPFLAVATGGTAAAPLAVVAAVGVMAAIAIPNFMKFKERAAAHAIEEQRRIDEPAADDGEGSPALEDNAQPAAHADETIRGASFNWEARRPNSSWSAIPIERAREQNPMADAWLTRADLDAHLLFIAEEAGTAALADVVQNVVANFRNAGGPSFELAGKQAFESALGKGELLHMRLEVAGQKLEYMTAVVISHGQALQVLGFSPREQFAKAKPELFATMRTLAPKVGLAMRAHESTE